MKATHLREFFDGVTDDHLEQMNAQLEASGRECADCFFQAHPTVNSQTLEAVDRLISEISHGLKGEFSASYFPDRAPETLRRARLASERVATNAFLRRLNALYEAAALKGGRA